MTQPSEKIPNVKVTVKSIKGRCALGHKVGEEFLFKGGIAPGGLCTEGMLTVIPGGQNFDVRRNPLLGRGPGCHLGLLP